MRRRNVVADLFLNTSATNKQERRSIVLSYLTHHADFNKNLY